MFFEVLSSRLRNWPQTKKIQKLKSGLKSYFIVFTFQIATYVLISYRQPPKKEDHWKGKYGGGTYWFNMISNPPVYDLSEVVLIHLLMTKTKVVLI